MAAFYEVKFADGLTLPCVNDLVVEQQIGQKVIVKNPRFNDLGTITRSLDKIHTSDANKRGHIIRLATEKDEESAEASWARNDELHQVALEEITHHKLKMKLIKTHRTMDGALVIFLFTSEGRVDFRELVKSLSRRVGTRIELRQIGVRDETAILGGIGSCGRSFCCKDFLHEFESINVRTAKDQGLPLNPTTISGVCGRLKCCLKYEHDNYLEMGKDLPRIGDRIKTDEGSGIVLELNPLKRSVRVKLDGPGEKIINVFFNKCNKNDCSCRNGGGCCGK